MVVYIIISLVLLLGYASAQNVEVNHTVCGGVVQAVRATPCESQPCVFKKGQRTTIEVDFISNKPSDKLKLSVTARLFQVDHTFPGMEDGADACQNHGLQCPIQNDKPLRFKMELEVPSQSPSLITTATFKLEGDDEPVFCFKAVAVIK